MSGELRIFRFAPNEERKGGTTVGLHTFMGIEDTRVVSGFRPYRRRWERDRKWSAFWINNYSPRQVLGFIDWHYFNTGSVGSLNHQILADGVTSLGVPTTGIRLTTYQDIYYETADSARALGPVTLLPVKDRLFFATGHGRPHCWTGATSGGVPTGVWRVGVPSPTVGPSVSVDRNYSSGQYFYGVSGSPYICYNLITSDANWDDLAPGEVVRLTHESLGAPGYVEKTVAERVSGTTLAGLPGDGPFPFHPNVAGGAKCSGTVGTDYLLVNRSFPYDADGKCPQFVGLTVKILTESYVIKEVTQESATDARLTLMSNLTASHASVGFSIIGVRVTLSEPLTFTSNAYGDAARKLSRPLPGVGYSSWSGSEAPGYAYAYYDPVSGHISNLSPVTYVDETDVVNGRIRIDTDAQEVCADGSTDVPYPSATGLQYVSDTGAWPQKYSSRFTKILWFRTRRVGGGAALYPLGSLDSSSGMFTGINGACPTTSGNVWTDIYGDEYLLASGRLSAPLTTNNRLRFIDHAGQEHEIHPQGMAFWDGRVWAFGDPDLGALHYSCDDAQAGMGRPEECFPDDNRLVIPAGDGEITSILTVGESLVVNTRGYSYRVVGNHESNYRLMLLDSGQTRGVTARRCTEIPQGVVGGAAMATATNDGVMLVAPDGGSREIGGAIRSYLGGTIYGMAFYRAGGHARLALAVDASSAEVPEANGLLLEYNFDHGIWTENRPDIGSTLQDVEFLTSIRATPGGTAFLGARKDDFLVAGVAGSLAYPTFVYGSSASRRDVAIFTWPVPAHTTKRRYAFAWARVLVVGAGVQAALGTGASLRVIADDDDSNQISYPLRAHTDPARKMIRSTFSPDGETLELVCFGAAGIKGANPANFAPVGYRLEFRLVIAGPTVSAIPMAIPFFEVALREVSEDGAVDP